MKKHTIIVGHDGAGKTLRAYELAHNSGQTHAGIRCISVEQVIDLYGIARAMRDDPAVLIIENVEPTDHKVWDFFSRIAALPTWTIHGKAEWPRRVAAPQMIVTTHALPAGWSAPDHIWRVIDMIEDEA